MKNEDLKNDILLKEQEHEKRKIDFFKRASNGFLLKLYRYNKKDSYVYNDYHGEMILDEKIKIKIYDAHWTNSLLKKGEKVNYTNRQYIETSIEEIREELNSRPHIKSKTEGKNIRKKLIKKKK